LSEEATRNKFPVRQRAEQVMIYVSELVYFHTLYQFTIISRSDLRN